MDLPLEILSSEAARSLPRHDSRRFLFKLPVIWRSPVERNPHADEAAREALRWFARLGCSQAEVQRAQAFDTAGYVGVPFPLIPREETIRLAKFLSLWLLWDDTNVETLENGWCLTADEIVSGARPPGLNRFEEGWWQLFREMADRRSAAWIRALCEAMSTWSDRAIDEALAVKRYRETRARPSFHQQLDLRIATIGMYATVYLLEDACGFELSPDFHALPAVRRIAMLSNELVGIGNDVLSLGKDQFEGQLNLVSTLMEEKGLSVEDAIAALIQRHDAAVVEYDELAASLVSEGDPRIVPWLEGLRYACVGFSLWEAQAPRYTARRVVSRDQVIEPGFQFTSVAG